MILSPHSYVETLARQSQQVQVFSHKRQSNNSVCLPVLYALKLASLQSPLPLGVTMLKGAIRRRFASTMFEDEQGNPIGALEVVQYTFTYAVFCLNAPRSRITAHLPRKFRPR